MELLKYMFSQTYLIVIIIAYILFMLYKVPKFKKLKTMYSYLKKSDENIYSKINDIESEMGITSFIFIIILLFSFAISSVDLDKIKEAELRKRIYEGKHEYIYTVIENNRSVFYLKTSNGWMKIEQSLYFELKNKGIKEN